MLDPNKGKWIEAMESEIESMYSNSVWELVNKPKDVKLVGFKWIYKRKRVTDGEIQTYKARLKDQGYTHKEGIDYKETFSPMVKLKLIRVFLSIV